MEIVINIDDHIIEHLKDGSFGARLDDRAGLIDAVMNGKPIEKKYDISDLMYEIYMEGVNMSGEYQGCWVRFKDIEKIMDKYVKGAINGDSN